MRHESTWSPEHVCHESIKGKRHVRHGGSQAQKVYNLTEKEKKLTNSYETMLYQYVIAKEQIQSMSLNKKIVTK